MLKRWDCWCRRSLNTTSCSIDLELGKRSPTQNQQHNSRTRDTKWHQCFEQQDVAQVILNSWVIWQNWQFSFCLHDTFKYLNIAINHKIQKYIVCFNGFVSKLKICLYGIYVEHSIFNRAWSLSDREMVKCAILATHNFPEFLKWYHTQNDTQKYFLAFLSLLKYRNVDKKVVGVKSPRGFLGQVFV